MRSQNQPSKHFFNYKLKPISLIIFSLFVQQAYAQDEQKNDEVSQALVNSSAIESKFVAQTSNKKQAKIVLADASTAVKFRSKNNTTEDASIDVYDVLLGDDPSASISNNQLPMHADRYNVKKEIILAATDTTGENTGPTKSKSAGKSSIDIDLKEVKVRAKRFKQIGPMPGLLLTKEQIPGNIQSVTAKEIKDAHSLSLTDLMNSKLQSVNVNDYQGNPFQMDVTYRGFTASPQLGTPQGLSVFLDGIRVNEPFGDVVNWDMIPMNALESMDVYSGSNPLFGLNTLGGALAVKTKSGFNFPGVSAEVLSGSFGRKQFQGTGGWNNGTLAAFGAVNLFLEDGWRDNSPSKVNQAFGKLEWQGERVSLALSGLGVTTKLVGNGSVPTELYNENPSAVFTSPDETRNKLLQFQLSGIFDVTDTFSVTGQVYNRDSTRRSSTGDIIDSDTFRDLGYASAKPAPGQTVTCAYADNNQDGLPDYYVLDTVGQANGFNSSVYAAYKTGTLDFSTLDPASFNQALPSDFYAPLVAAQTGGSTAALQPNDIVYSYVTKTALPALHPLADSFYIDRIDPSIYHTLLIAPAMNESTCLAAKGQLASNTGKLLPLGSDGLPVKTFRDGAMASGTNNFGTASGVIDGTPNAIITKSNIEQTSTGGSLQLNWNFDQHKLLLGGSVDQVRAKYAATQRFGLLDANRNAYLDPSAIGAEYLAASQDIPLNDFAGSSTTESLYLSETWSPISTLNFAFSSRYNYSEVENKLAPAKKGFSLAGASLTNRYAFGVICPGGVCPFDPSKPLSPADYAKFIDAGFIDGSANSLAPAHTEKFNYHSLNPSVGMTWQATPQLNLYTNWNQGTRLPSVIELGCAFDATPVLATSSDGNPLTDANGNQFYRARSVQDGRGCSLPNALSGDPYLPQVTAQTFEIGARGKFKDLLEWNISAYQTNLKDDIYLVSVTPALNFFQDVGATRRQGLEMGLSGAYGKSDFRIGYSLTEATFQSSFKMLSPSNSSTLSNDTRSANYNMIQVSPGDQLPGIPLNNLNLSWGYKVTPAFKVGLTMVGHAGSFLRGNENNQHTAGPGKGVVTTVTDPDSGLPTVATVATPAYNYTGKAPGYAVLNLRTTYDLGKGWSAGAIVNNLLDKKYFSAGRLGITPFSPSVNGAIGASGFNYNSSEWLSTQFMSAGAPRGVWLTLAYDFDASKKSEPPSSTSSLMLPEPDRLPEASPQPTAQELAIQKAIQASSTLPVLKTGMAQANAAVEQQVTAAVQNWQHAWAANDTVAYLQSYASGFVPEGMSRTAWEDKRKMQLATDSKPLIEIDHLMIAPQGKRMTAVFSQTLHQPQQNEVTEKILYLEQQEGRWLIIREHSSPPIVKANAASAMKQFINKESGHHNLKVSLNKEVK